MSSQAPRRRRLAIKFTYANVMATVAVFLMLSGAAFALVVTSSMVKDGTLMGRDIRLNTIPGSKIKNNSITGVDVNEFSLNLVPDSDKLDGLDSSQFTLLAGRTTSELFTPADDGTQTVDQLSFTPPVDGLVTTTFTCSAVVTGAIQLVAVPAIGGDQPNYFHDIAGAGMYVISVTKSAAVTGGTPITAGGYILKASGAGLLTGCFNSSGSVTFTPTKLDGLSY